jgi:hypothetical protein
MWFHRHGEWGLLARFVDSFFILNTEQIEGHGGPQEICQWLRHREMTAARHWVGDRSASAQRSGGTIYSAAFHGQLERADTLGQRDIGIPALSQLRNYPRMGRPPGDRVANIHLLRLRNGLRRFVG